MCVVDAQVPEPGTPAFLEWMRTLYNEGQRLDAASANVETLDGGAEGMDVVTGAREGVTLNRVMSNSFGFGGTNATLIFQRFEG